MGLISTPYLTYRELRTADDDILEDAFALRSEFPDVYTFLGKADCSPGEQVVKQLITIISERREKSSTG